MEHTKEVVIDGVTFPRFQNVSEHCLLSSLVASTKDLYAAGAHLQTVGRSHIVPTANTVVEWLVGYGSLASAAIKV